MIWEGNFDRHLSPVIRLALPIDNPHELTIDREITCFEFDTGFSGDLMVNSDLAKRIAFQRRQSYDQEVTLADSRKVSTRVHRIVVVVGDESREAYVQYFTPLPKSPEVVVGTNLAGRAFFLKHRIDMRVEHHGAISIRPLYGYSLPSEMKRIRCHGIVSEGDWRVKLYSISPTGRPTAEKSLAFAKMHLTDFLSSLQIHHTSLGLGFASLQEGVDSHSLSLGLWTSRYSLALSNFLAEEAEELCFESLDSISHTCIWNIELLSFERESWLRHVVSKSKSNPDAYLAENPISDI